MSGTQREGDRRAVIVGGRRTPIGRFLGSLSAIPASDLGATAIRAALESAGVSADAVERVIMGQVLTAGAGQLPARQAAAAAGIPMSVSSTTINKVCLSGIAAVAQAALEVRADGVGLMVAGGQESMSLAPHLLRGRTGTKYGDITMADHAALDGLTDAFTGEPMGLLTERQNDADPITREDQDAFAVASHARAAAAWEDERFADEVVPVLGRNGDTLLDRDESVRPGTSAATLARLRPSFRAEGTITAGNASPLSDGAAALLVAEAGRAAELGLEPLAEIVATASVAGPDSSLQLQPANAIRAVCARAGVDPSELAVAEINEAFAAVGLASTRELGLNPEAVNPNGGAIALGHPIGMSGARIVLHLALELRRRGGGLGAAALCGGGGQGDAILLRV